MTLVKKRLTEVANGVLDDEGKFFPYRHVIVNTVITSLSPITKNNAFYIKCGSFIVRTIAADTGTLCYVSGLHNLELNYISFLYVVPSVAQIIYAPFNSGILLDKGASLDFSGPNITISSCDMVVAEIEDI